MHRPYNPEHKRALSPRETEVVRLTAAGMSAKQIAAELRITERTVAYFKLGARQKLGVGTMAEVIVWAARNSILQETAA